MLHTQFDLISLSSFQFTLYLALVQTKVLLRRGRFSEDERDKGFNYLQGIMSICTVLNLWSRWGGGVNVCSAALMCSPAQPKDGASSANKPQGQREGSKQGITSHEGELQFSRNEWGVLLQKYQILLFPRFQYFPCSLSCSQQWSWHRWEWTWLILFQRA